MSDIKERILGAVSIMSDKEAAKIWDLFLATFALENAEEVQPDESEHSAFRPSSKANLNINLQSLKKNC